MKRDFLANKALNLKLKNEVINTLPQYLSEALALKVDYVGYREFYNDGTSMAFCSNEEWYNVIQDKETFDSMAIHYSQELMSLNRNGFNYVIRTPACINNHFLRELLLRDMCNSLLIYKKDRKIIRMYSFIASISNLSALNYFFNRWQSFEMIVNTYKDELAGIFKKKEYQQLRQPLFNQKILNNIFNQIQEITPANVNCDILTQIEMEYLPLLATRASNKDIAVLFNVSTRTVQYHVANIKRKLKVSNRLNIIGTAQNKHNS